MPNWLIGLELFFFSFLLSFVLIPIFKNIALKFNIVDQPGERKMHHRPKALLGGVAIFTAFFSTTALHVLLFLLRSKLPFLDSLFESNPDLYNSLSVINNKIVALLCGAVLIVALGFWDDKFGTKFPVKIKFVCQFIAAGIAVFGGIVTKFMPGQTLDILITIIWIVGITNAFNLLDNMDGLSAGIATIVGILLFIITIIQGQILIAFILAVFVGSVSAFLPYNLYPSKLFMGDSGSMFLGYFLGCITVNASYITEFSPTFVPVIIPLIILAVPLFDTLSVIFIRIRNKKPIWIGDKNHFSHRLVKLGMRQSEAAVFIFIVTLAIGIVALLLPGAEMWESIVILIQMVLFFALISFLMFVAKSREHKDE